MLENEYEIVVPLFSAAYAAPNKTQFYTDLGILATVLNPTENSTIQGLFKAFE